MTEPIEHIKLLTAPDTLDVDPRINIQSLETLLEMVRRTAPFIVLDIPYGWSDWVQHSLMQADEIVLTSTLDLVSLRDTKNIIDILDAKRVNDAPPRLVINKQGAYSKTELSDKDFETAMGCSAAMVIEYNPALFGAAENNGQTIGAMKPGEKIVESFHELAQLVSGMGAPKSKNKHDDESQRGLFSFLKKKGKD